MSLSRMMLGSELGWRFKPTKKTDVQSWVSEIIEVSTQVEEILRKGGRICLNNKVDERQLEPKELSLATLGYKAKVVETAAVYFAWLYAYVRSTGGLFELNNGKLKVEVHPHKGLKLKLEVGPEAPDGCDITLVGKKRKNMSYPLIEVLNHAFYLFDVENNSHGIDAVRYLHDIDISWGNGLIDNSKSWKVSDFPKFKSPPWLAVVS